MPKKAEEISLNAFKDSIRQGELCFQWILTNGYARHFRMKLFHNLLSIGVGGLLSGTLRSMFGLSKMAPFDDAPLLMLIIVFN